jgi:hypothetical protein
MATSPEKPGGGAQDGGGAKRPGSGVSARKYPMPDVKALFAKSAGFCAFPKCLELCIKDATELDGIAVYAKIAHIVGHSDNGPRSDPSMGQNIRDSYQNWILLCPNHHDIVDLQENTYTVEDLRKWKADHERKVARALAQQVVKIGFAELQQVTSALLEAPLSGAVTDHLRMALAKAKEVRAYIQQISRLHPDFPERLKAGLRKEL